MRVQLHCMAEHTGIVMLNEVKHLANEYDQRSFPCYAQILR